MIFELIFCFILVVVGNLVIIPMLVNQISFTRNRISKLSEKNKKMVYRKLVQILHSTVVNLCMLYMFTNFNSSSDFAARFFHTYWIWFLAFDLGLSLFRGLMTRPEIEHHILYLLIFTAAPTYMGHQLMFKAFCCKYVGDLFNFFTQMRTILAIVGEQNTDLYKFNHYIAVYGFIGIRLGAIPFCYYNLLAISAELLNTIGLFPLIFLTVLLIFTDWQNIDWSRRLVTSLDKYWRNIPNDELFKYSIIPRL
jgi:hypothetical protein